MDAVKKVALAYSGGLDTSVIIPWLRETYGCEVVAVVADVGQDDDLEAITRKALQGGAAEAYVVDVQQAFATHYLFPALRAHAVYEGRYLLGTALARPLIARAQVAVSNATGCDALAHGCTGKGNDQVRFELAYKALAPGMRVIAPWREWHLRGRDEEIAYAAARGIPVPASRERPYSMDRNLWHLSFEGGILEDPWDEPPEEMYVLTDDPRAAPDEPESVEIEFERATPVAVNGRRMGPAALIASLNETAGRHGVGRVDIVENRLVGMKSRGVYETPAGTVLTAALLDLEGITLDRDTWRQLQQIGPRYADLVYNGLWYTPLRRALDAFAAEAGRNTNGVVRVRLFKGSCLPVARRSDVSLYYADLATFEADAVYDQADAAGFISLWGLPAQVVARVHREWVDDGPPIEVPVPHEVGRQNT